MSLTCFQQLKSSSSPKPRSKMVNPVVFFDVSIGGKAAGRIVFTLFAGNWWIFCNSMLNEPDNSWLLDSHHIWSILHIFSDVVPKTAENFRSLCTGELKFKCSSRYETLIPIFTHPIRLLLTFLCLQSNLASIYLTIKYLSQARRALLLWARSPFTTRAVFSTGWSQTSCFRWAIELCIISLYRIR